MKADLVIMEGHAKTMIMVTRVTASLDTTGLNVRKVGFYAFYRLITALPTLKTYAPVALK